MRVLRVRGMRVSALLWAAASLLIAPFACHAAADGDAVPDWALPYVTCAERVAPEWQWQSARLSTEQHRRVVVLDSPRGTVCVDVETGVVTWYFGSGLRGPSPLPDIPEKEAVDRATEITARAGVDVRDGWTLTSVKLQDAGTAGHRYDVDWRRFHFGIRLPSFISVMVNAATGAVTSFLMVDDPVKIPMEFPLSWQAAVERLVGEGRGKSMRIELVEPHITYDPEPPWRQRAVWHIEAFDAATGEYRGGRVDAVTGEVERWFHARSRAAKGRATQAKASKRFTAPRIDWRAARRSKPPRTAFQLYLAAHGPMPGARTGSKEGARMP